MHNIVEFSVLHFMHKIEQIRAGSMIWKAYNLRKIQKCNLKYRVIYIHITIEVVLLLNSMVYRVRILFDIIASLGLYSILIKSECGDLKNMRIFETFTVNWLAKIITVCFQYMNIVGIKYCLKPQYMNKEISSECYTL